MKLYNTLTRKKEKFNPINENKVGIYCCGPTVYNYAHIGNLRTYINEDILIRTLRYLGYEVEHVMNITDVGHLVSDADEGEDKMIKAAKREKKNPLEIAKFYEKAFFEDIEKLNIMMPDVKCRATEHIKEMIELVKTLEEKGYTYFENGNVYFDISKFDKYPDFAKLDLDAKSINRVEVDENKKNPQDFVLWFTNSKFENQILEWDSPWGKGYPGWHIECSAMSMKYLGEEIDIHCGGIDHISVHHTNEIAQSEAATGKKWVNYWVHGEHLKDETGKMSKSKGDFLTLEKLEKEGFKPVYYRFFCLNSRYRKQLTFSFDMLKKAQKTYKKLKRKVLDIEDTGRFNEERFKEYKDKFSKEIKNDLNIANGLTVLYDLLKDEKVNGKTKIQIIKDFEKVLALDLLKKEQKELPKEAIKLLEERKEARKNKDYKKSDELRDKLLELGVKVKDTRDGMEWMIK